AVEWMRRRPLGPLENETILVQSNDIGQWLKLALAEDPKNGGAGIAAALEVMLPARFLWQAYRTVLTHVSQNADAVPESVAQLDALITQSETARQSVIETR
ncbi:exodeoxyribonuclease V subunit gamma, partial [Ralstonia pseudosolanacearum]|uniref:exodeoxyribonuclease V subunit gamma n=1 Tax=Ralstonia pseudosolanacearum TaxID=1310165 RepID=UPI003CF93941